MHHKLISGDNHIDLTYCPADLWSAQAPAKWKKNAPRVEERNDGQHWFVDDKDRGMWNGVGPGFLPYTKGSFGHVDEMKEAGFEWDSFPAPGRGRPRRSCASPISIATGSTTPRSSGRLPDDQRPDRRRGAATSGPMPATTTGPPISPVALDPNTRLAARHHPEHRPRRRRGRGATLRYDLELKGGDLALQAAWACRSTITSWYALWEAAAECRFPISFHSTGFKAVRGAQTRPEMEKELWPSSAKAGALGAVPARSQWRSLVSLARLWRLREVSRLHLRAWASSGVTWLALCLRSPRHRVSTTAPAACGFKLKPSD